MLLAIYSDQCAHGTTAEADTWQLYVRQYVHIRGAPLARFTSILIQLLRRVLPCSPASAWAAARGFGSAVLLCGCVSTCVCGRKELAGARAGVVGLVRAVEAALRGWRPIPGLLLCLLAGARLCQAVRCLISALRLTRLRLGLNALASADAIIKPGFDVYT